MSISRGVKDLSFWWLQGLPPVSEDVAKARADVCRKCPMNEPETLFEVPTGLAAEAFKAALELKHKMNLKLENENELGVCGACECELRLKPWVPKEVLFRGGKPPDYFQKLHHTCWVRKL